MYSTTILQYDVKLITKKPFYNLFKETTVRENFFKRMLAIIKSFQKMHKEKRKDSHQKKYLIISKPFHSESKNMYFFN